MNDLEVNKACVAAFGHEKCVGTGGMVSARAVYVGTGDGISARVEIYSSARVAI